MGFGAATRKILVLDPMLGWADPPMVLCMIFTRDGFWSMVLDALACINMYYNIERNIMNNEVGSLSFGIQGESLRICVMLSHCLFSVL